MVECVKRLNIILEIHMRISPTAFSDWVQLNIETETDGSIFMAQYIMHSIIIFGLESDNIPSFLSKNTHGIRFILKSEQFINCTTIHCQQYINCNCKFYKRLYNVTKFSLEYFFGNNFEHIIYTSYDNPLVYLTRIWFSFGATQCKS